MIPAFEHMKTVHALDHAATVIGLTEVYLLQNFHNGEFMVMLHDFYWGVTP
jgi:hypothetical protein